MSLTLTADVLKKYPNEVFIETGTYDGGGAILAVRSGFRDVRTIEIDPLRILEAHKHLSEFPQVMFYQGDSPQMLAHILFNLEKRATIWLDAHPMGDSDPCPGGQFRYPLITELQSIALFSKRKDHSILIDDRHAFKKFGASDEEIQKMLLGINPTYKIVMEPNASGETDILGAHPKE